MPINISKIVEKTQEITGGSTELELSRVAEVGNIIEDSSVYSVPTTTDLPTAANNTGRFAYVDDQCRYYYSNGTSWTDDYVTTDLTSLQIWMFGINNCGQLGLNNITDYSTPTQEVCGGTNWCMVSAGSFHNSAAIKTDGTLWSWGCNNFGQLGTNNQTNYSTPQQEACGGTTWCMVTVKSLQSAAIKTDGTLWSWGHNYYGELGLNNTTTYSTPTQEVCGFTDWCMVTSGDYHTSAIKTDGTLWSWGRNNFFGFIYLGVLGTNDTTDYSTPQQEVCGGTNWCSVNGGTNHTSAIKTDGTLWGWGDNSAGQLGTNNTICYSTPQQETCGGTNWCTVSAGGYHTSALKTDGTLWGWGRNQFGQLGLNNTTTCYSTPQQEACGFTDWIQPFLRGTIDTSGF